MDVIYLAFSNSATEPLPTLSKEADEVHRILVHRALQGDFLIHLDQHATIEKINHDLGVYRDRLAVFHFSGHAGQDALVMGGEEANPKGIALQLAESARIGKLKLVVLNGCSTAGQVNRLLELGIPSVIATHAPVGDFSATAFAGAFYKGLAVNRWNLEQAFAEALGPAQTTTKNDLISGWEEAKRGIQWRDTPKDRPLWGLFPIDRPDNHRSNPLPLARSAAPTSFQPNEKLIPGAFEALLKAGCRPIQRLQEREEEGDFVETGAKATEIVNVLPSPVGIHLQKLIAPVEGSQEGFDKVNRRRLEQIGWFYHTTVEFLAFILLAQLWDLQQKKVFDRLPDPLRATLKDYFYAAAAERRVFSYMPFIRALRVFFDSLNGGQGASYFVEELSQLKEVADAHHPFGQACDYLYNLHRMAVQNSLQESEVPAMCREAEDHLCAFIAELGFLHRYTLGSVQHIEIQNYRHLEETVFSHQIFKLMRAFGRPEPNYYLLSDFLHNRAVALLKDKAKVVNRDKRQFSATRIEGLNLSPLVIDRNAFEDNTDLTNLLFFEQYRPNSNAYGFRNVKKPDSDRDRLEVRVDNEFEMVFYQLEAFRRTILQEPGADE